MELLSDGKYVVFKVEQFEEMIRRVIESDVEGAEEEEIEGVINSYAIADSTVIRAQDIFSAPALYAYATAVSVAKMMMDGAHPYYPSLNRLEEFFLERAEEAQKFGGKKLPD